MGFNFGLSSKSTDNRQDVMITERERSSPRGDDVYGMKPLGSVDSRERIGLDEYEKSGDARANKAPREYSKDDSDIVGAEPKHMLAYAG